MTSRRPISVGDLVLVVNAEYFVEWNGTIARVVSGLGMRRSRNLHTLEFEEFRSYRVRLADGTIACAYPHQVRRIDPDNEPDEAVKFGQRRQCGRHKQNVELA